jgi:hypothetical protein
MQSELVTPVKSSGIASSDNGFNPLPSACTMYNPRDDMKYTVS